MNLSKQEFMEQAWIHINTRLPPNIDDDVLTLSVNGILLCIPGFLARQHAEIMLNIDYYKQTMKDLTEDRRIKYWMPIYLPQGAVPYIRRLQAGDRKGKRATKKEDQECRAKGGYI